MAKGRKLTFSLSERYLGSYNNNYDSIASGTSVSDAPEIGEEDVWSTIDDRNEDAREKGLGNGNSYRDWSSCEGSSMAMHSRVKNGGSDDGGGRRQTNVGGLSLAFEDLRVTAAPTPTPRIVHQFKGNEGAPSPRGGKTACSAPVNVPDWSKIYRMDSVESMHGCSDEEEMLPPHEYLARSRRTAAESVFEGVGRTLKGRDMRRVRDAVWSQTGFDG